MTPSVNMLPWYNIWSYLCMTIDCLFIQDELFDQCEKWPQGETAHATANSTQKLCATKRVPLSYILAWNKTIVDRAYKHLWIRTVVKSTVSNLYLKSGAKWGLMIEIIIKLACWPSYKKKFCGLHSKFRSSYGITTSMTQHIMTCFCDTMLSSPHLAWGMCQTWAIVINNWWSLMMFSGKLYKSSDLEQFAKFLLLFYQEQPVDWLYR